MESVIGIPLLPLFQNLIYCLIVAIYSHLFAGLLTLGYWMLGNGATARINSNPLAACFWRLGAHWLGAVIGMATILGVF